MIITVAIAALFLPTPLQDSLPAGESGSFAIIVDGVRQGTSTYRVEAAEDDGIIIHGQTQLTYDARQITIESQTYISADGQPSAYRMSAVSGNQRQVLEVDFAEGKANCVLRAGGVRNESQVALPGRWALFDNNSAAHLALLATRLRPGMDPDGGQIFVPSTFTLADYSISPLGAGLHDAGGIPVQTQLYKMILANKVEVDLHVVAGQLVAMSQPAEGIEFIRESAEETGR